MSYPTDLTDEQWTTLEPLLRRKAGPGAPREVDIRAIVNAIRYKLRTGCQWRMLPKEYPPKSTVWYYFNAWQQDGTLERVNDALRKRVRTEQLEREPDPHIVVVDSQSVKSTEAGGDRGFDAGKKYPGSETSSSG
ncbi:MAG TPA: IS5 family transposase [Roseiflexaceae bacterium]|nr:IS5 family transposase [Roseiflexaceae bacterium]